MSYWVQCRTCERRRSVPLASCNTWTRWNWLRGRNILSRSQVSNDYPFKPPRVHFRTPILHPNVHSKSGVGYLSLDYAKNWSPAWTISKLLLAIRLILSDPNPNDPLNSELTELYLKDRETYHKQVRKHTEEHAIKKKQDYCLITFQRQPSQLSPLTGLCRIAIRNRLRENNPAEANHNIKLLPLPTRIKQFLLVSYPFWSNISTYCNCWIFRAIVVTNIGKYIYSSNIKHNIYQLPLHTHAFNVGFIVQDLIGGTQWEYL